MYFFGDIFLDLAKMYNIGLHLRSMLMLNFGSGPYETINCYFPVKFKVLTKQLFISLHFLYVFKVYIWSCENSQVLNPRTSVLGAGMNSSFDTVDFTCVLVRCLVKCVFQSMMNQVSQVTLRMYLMCLIYSKWINILHQLHFYSFPFLFLLSILMLNVCII